MSTNTDRVDVGEYYRVHTCKTCADGPDTTPLEYALSVMSVPNWKAFTVLTDHADQFSLGWLMGVEGRAEFRRPPINQNPDQGAIHAWLVGYLAGEYAGKYNFGTPVCRETDGTHEWIEPHLV